jgi:hypothetical protein
MKEPREEIIVRNTRSEDCAGIVELTRQVYPDSAPWMESQLVSHLNVFGEGQFVAVESATQRVVGMAASLIILWNDYDMAASWRDFTDAGMFTNHDPAHGRALYGAEAMVAPLMQGVALVRNSTWRGRNWWNASDYCKSELERACAAIINMRLV